MLDMIMHCNIKPVVLHDGIPINSSELLSKRCDLVFATLGKLVDILTKPHKLNNKPLLYLDRLELIVFDDAEAFLQSN